MLETANSAINSAIHSRLCALRDRKVDRCYAGLCRTAVLLLCAGQHIETLYLLLSVSQPSGFFHWPLTSPISRVGLYNSHTVPYYLYINAELAPVHIHCRLPTPPDSHHVAAARCRSLPGSYRRLAFLHHRIPVRRFTYCRGNKSVNSLLFWERCTRVLGLRAVLHLQSYDRNYAVRARPVLREVFSLAERKIPSTHGTIL